MTGRWARERLGEGLSRRSFLKVAGSAAIVAAAGAAGCSAPAGPPAATASPAPTPLAQKTAASQQTTAARGSLIVSSDGDPAKAVDKALEAYGGLGELVSSGDTVLLKPNFTFARTPAQGAANHPAVLARIARLCKDAGAAEVIIVDHTIDSGPLCLDKTGIKKELAASGFTAVCINAEGDFEERAVPGKALKTAQVARKLADADVFINVPVIKSHGDTRITAGLKNLMGLVWDRQAFHYPGPLDDCIVDLAGLLKPDLVIADAYRVLKTNGPGGPGEVTEPHEIIVGEDQVAVDAYAAGLLGLRPEDVDHIRLAAEAGLGKMDLSGLTRV